MDFLASRYRPVSLTELLAARRGERLLPLRSVLVTFDDGYRDFAEHAWPILRRLGIPAVLFVPTAYPGDPGRAFWWDRLYGAVSSTIAETIETPYGELQLASSAERMDTYRRLRGRVKSLPHAEGMTLVDEICETLGAPSMRSDVLGWPELRRLESEGVDLAPHSRTHPLLDKVPVETARSRDRRIARGSRARGREAVTRFCLPVRRREPRGRAHSRRGGVRARVLGGARDERHPHCRLAAASAHQCGTSIRGAARARPASAPVAGLRIAKGGSRTPNTLGRTNSASKSISCEPGAESRRHDRPCLQTSPTCGKGE